MYHHILVPLDHSPADETILSHLERLAKFCGSQLTFLHIADGFGARYQKTLNLADSEEIRKDEIYLRDIQDRFRRQGFQTQIYLGRGDPVQEIINYVEKNDCDLIAMSTHGHGPVKDLIFGSVASAVRHRTEVPILLIRMPQK
jgi:nucleotide-binding universal stress UspA family protein